MPAPISMTPTPGAAPPSSAMRGQTVGLMRKFCPRALEKVNPWRPSRSLMTEMLDNFKDLSSKTSKMMTAGRDKASPTALLASL